MSPVAGIALPKARDADDRSALFDEAFLKKLEYLHIVSRKIFAGQNLAQRRTKKTGSGVEFADHRMYAAGDDFRYIDWNLYGRMDRLLLRLFEEEEDLSIHLLLDTSRSMVLGTPPKLHYAMQLVAALAYVGLGNLDRVSIQPFSDALGARMPPTRGKGRIFKVFEFMRQLQIGGTTNLTVSATQFVHQAKRRGLVVVVSDFYDPTGYEEGLNVLRYHKHEPFVIQLYDKREADPPLHGDLTLLDCETGDLREVTVSPKLLARYRAEHEAYCSKLSEFCTQRQIPFFRTLTAVPFDELVLKIFRKGGFLK